MESKGVRVLLKLHTRHFDLLVFTLAILTHSKIATERIPWLSYVLVLDWRAFELFEGTPAPRKENDACQLGVSPIFLLMSHLKSATGNPFYLP